MTSCFLDLLTQATEYLENRSIKCRIQTPCSYVITSIATVSLNSEAKGRLTTGLRFLLLYRLQVSQFSDTSFTIFDTCSLSFQILADSINFSSLLSLQWPNCLCHLMISSLEGLAVIHEKIICTSSCGASSIIFLLFVSGIG